MQKIFNITSTSGYETTLLYIISVVSIFLGIYIIISKNPILSILFLIGLFFSISMYLIMIGLHFIGLSYLLIYVGAVSILFLFILMLINIRISELLTDNKNSIPLAIIAVLCFSYFVDRMLPYNMYTDIANNFALSSFNTGYNSVFSIKAFNETDDIVGSLLYYISSYNFAGVFSKSWDTILISTSHITSIGNILYTNLFILFIISSLILLLAMVGAIVITINKTGKIKPYNFD